MSSESGAFVGVEKAGSSSDSTAVLLRFVRSVPTIATLLLPSILLAFIATAGYQLFSWLAGVLVSCHDGATCVAHLADLGVRVSESDGLPSALEISLVGLFALAVSLVAFRVIGWIVFEVGGQIACIRLFVRMMERLTGTRTTFFDEQPSGRIINRTVRDFDQLRYMGPIRIGDTTNALIELLVAGIVIGFAHPLAGLVVAPTLIVFLYIQRNIAPMLQFCIVQRSIRFGEVLHRETDAIEGIRTFLLYGQDRSLFRRLRGAMTSFSQIHLLRSQIEAWGRFWSTLASSLCSFVALCAVAYALSTGAISMTLAAVIITAVLKLSGMFGWLTWSLGYLFETAGHARRILEYVDLPNEESEEGSVSGLRSDAGASGELAPGALVFSGYSMSYRKDSPVVLNELTFEIPMGMQVGIVGRTGAGKSSLVQALFRMVFVRGGDIALGGRSIFSVSVAAARRAFAVMPQDPYLFAGTIRDNLDPLKVSSDDRLLGLLRECQLGFALDHAVLEGGVNLSVGQRQLVGLARVLLSDAPVVVMDEPTSSIDPITDELIQRMLREKLKGRTVLTIAHRLGTLRTSDLIIELEAGHLKRIGPPQEILPQIVDEIEALTAD